MDGVHDLSTGMNSMSISMGVQAYDNSADGADIDMLMQALDGSSIGGSLGSIEPLRNNNDQATQPVPLRSSSSSPSSSSSLSVPSASGVAAPSTTGSHHASADDSMNLAQNLNPGEKDALDYFDDLFTTLGGEAPRLSGAGSSAAAPAPASASMLPPPPSIPRRMPTLSSASSTGASGLGTPESEPRGWSGVGARPGGSGKRKSSLKPETANKVFAIEHGQSTDRQNFAEGVMSVEYRNAFYDRYWRNKRHNVQCFPKDAEYGDYCNWLMAPDESKGELGAAVPVVVEVQLQPAFLSALSNATCASHIISLSARGAGIQPGDAPTTVGGLPEFAKQYTMGSPIEIAGGGGGTRLRFKTYPKLWKYGGQLPKKRKQGMDYRLCLETIILGSMQGSGPLQPVSCIAVIHSPPFELGSTRTLMRLKAKHKEQMRAPNDVSARNPQVKRAAASDSVRGASSLAVEQLPPKVVHVQGNQALHKKSRVHSQHQQHVGKHEEDV